MKPTTYLGIALQAGASTLHAQVATKRGLTLDGARRVIAGAVAEAQRHTATGVIAVVDEGGNLMAVERLDGTFAAGANISIGKARTAALFKRPTKVFEDVIKAGRTSMVALNDFTPLQGGLPIVVDGQVIGAVGVSGANSAQQDEELAIAGAAALTSLMQDSGPSPVTGVQYWERRDVDAAFEKGAVLLGADAGRNFMVHASRRDGPGMAEVHDRDTDIIHVLEGTATIVTGGRVVDGKVTALEESRGTSIEDGERRTLSKGDVIIVPNGTPHWFHQVRGPFKYYVVKVR